MCCICWHEPIFEMLKWNCPSNCAAFYTWQETIAVFFVTFEPFQPNRTDYFKACKRPLCFITVCYQFDAFNCNNLKRNFQRFEEKPIVFTCVLNCIHKASYLVEGFGWDSFKFVFILYSSSILQFIFSIGKNHHSQHLLRSINPNCMYCQVCRLTQLLSNPI